MSGLHDLLNILIGKLNKAVKTETQTLTDTQKSQARANIGAAAPDETVMKNDVTAEAWTFTLSDGSVVSKSVIVSKK